MEGSPLEPQWGPPHQALSSDLGAPACHPQPRSIQPLWTEASACQHFSWTVSTTETHVSVLGHWEEAHSVYHRLCRLSRGRTKLGSGIFSQNFTDLEPVEN